MAAKFALIGAYGNSTPFWDQWDGEAGSVLLPAKEGHLQFSQLFAAHCEHRIFLTRVLVLGLFHLNSGIWDPKVEMAAQALLHAGCITFLIALLGRSLSSYPARMLAGVFTVVIFAIPFGWENTLWGFQSQFYFVTLWGLVGIACCWRHSTLSRGWCLGVLAFCLGLLSMASGLLAPAVTCGLLLMRALHDRRDWRRQGCGLLVLGSIVGIGFLLVRNVPGHDGLKAQNLLQFFTALLKIMSWPAKIFWLAPLFQAPLVLLLSWALWKRRPATDPAWLLIILGAWGMSQSAAIAYGRALGYSSSRYTDNFSLTLCIGFACLLYLLFRINGRLKMSLIVLSFGWFAVVGGSILHASITGLPAKIAEKKALSVTGESHVRAYLASRDVAELTDKPFLHVPYPNPVKLAALLDLPALRDILPTNLRPELSPARQTISPEGGFRPNGYPPSAAVRLNDTVWGSYASSTDAPAAGVIELGFPACDRTSWLKMSMTGNPRASGISLTVIDEQNHSKNITPPPGSIDSWRSLFFRRPPGPFTLRIVDNNPTEWLAFTLPREVGPATLATGFFVGKAGWIACLGLALVAFTIARNPESRQFRSRGFLKDLTTTYACLLKETRGLKIASYVVPIAVFVLLAWRQHRFVDHFAVNMMLLDQWDFYNPVFKNGSAWSIFTQQHGPHRQGLGFLITNLLAHLSNWDSRWDAFAVSFAMMAAAGLALWLAVKHAFRFAGAAIFCALLFLNLRQYEIFVGASNLSHGALPVLMLVAACLCWFIQRPWVRAGLLSVLTFMMIFTGFGIFAGLVIPCALLADGLQVWRSGDRTRLVPIAATLAVIGIAWILFAQHYVFAPAVDNFKFPHDKPWEYLIFMGLMLTNTVGIFGYGVGAQTMGIALCLVVVAVCLWHGGRLLSKNPAAAPASQVIFTLTAFTLIYAANTAVGRICLGLPGALSSRYITLMLPAFLGLFLHCSCLPARLRSASTAVLIIGIALGMLIPHKKDWQYIRWFHDGRQAWRTAYLETHDEVIANQRSGFSVYPTPGIITQRLQFLEEHHLNLFKEPGESKPAP